MKRLTMLMLLAVFSASLLAGCNTTKGLGKDLQKVGEKMEGAAEDSGGTEPN